MDVRLHGAGVHDNEAVSEDAEWCTQHRICLSSVAKRDGHPGSCEHGKLLCDWPLLMVRSKWSKEVAVINSLCAEVDRSTQGSLFPPEARNDRTRALLEQVCTRLQQVAVMRGAADGADVVAVALYGGHGDNLDHVLLEQRSTPANLAGSWVFPGGKVQTDELLLDAAAREAKEELGIMIDKDAATLVHITTVNRWRVHLFTVTSWRKRVRPAEGQTLQWFADRLLLDAHYRESTRLTLGPSADEAMMYVLGFTDSTRVWSNSLKRMVRANSNVEMPRGRPAHSADQALT